MGDDDLGNGWSGGRMGWSGVVSWSGVVRNFVAGMHICIERSDPDDGTESIPSGVPRAHVLVRTAVFFLSPLRLARDACSIVLRLKQAIIDYLPSSPPPLPLSISKTLVAGSSLCFIHPCVLKHRLILDITHL